MFDTKGMSFAEIRRLIRGTRSGDPPLPPARQPEHISEVLRRIGFGKQRGQDDERETRND